MKKLVLAGAVVALAPISANADIIYMAIGLGAYNYTEEVTIASTEFEAKSNGNAVSFSIGTELSQNLALEATVATGLDNKTVDIDGYDPTVKLKLDSLFGAYGVFKAPISNSAEVFAKIGVTKLSGTATGNGVSIDSTDSSLSYGFGIDFYHARNAGIRIEYMNFYDKGMTTIDSVNLQYKFYM